MFNVQCKHRAMGCETVCVFMKFKDGEGERLLSQYGC